MSEAIKLFQYNTLGALMAGLYGGTLTVGELLEHGDLGLGTLDSIDGELIVLDGKAYQAKGSEGKVEVVEVSPDERYLMQQSYLTKLKLSSVNVMK